MQPLQPRRRRSGDDNMIPLINIVFLLLIFFMIAGRISTTVPNLELPVSRDGEKPVEQTVRISITRENILFIDGESVDLEQLAKGLSGVSSVNLSADKTLNAAQLDSVLNVIRDTGIAKVTLLAQGASRQ